MRVFITGASGWIGSATVDELLAGGHEVVGLARSEASAAALEAKGAQVRRGDLDDLESIRTGAAEADAVIHLANKHDWSNQAATNKAERAAVEAIGEAMAGSNRPFLLASGVGTAPGRAYTENDPSPNHGPDSPRGGSENLALEYVDRGVHTICLRFSPSVHGAGDPGLIRLLVGTAREKGVSGYVDDGASRWPAVHRSDAARLVGLGLQKASAGAILHAVGEEGIASREIAEAIGRGLGVPAVSIAREDAVAHFGWLGGFFGMDVPTSSTLTRQLLGWTPTGPTLLEDLATDSYFR
ncbi:SDR family oxidoreductase [Kribbella qitaiheensis]|uniref:SDR family oxidoreductase n=1 Tax=Kribbella qitaiheensis TaxID=1544730 RepID=A0A7G6X368_9ACTN|nr:SDR family oxidoreductase [Kribbella qitaiheensis]QNE20683.1 SDR family oxidoreductase [Kribbella qitaiheensis]